MPIEVIIAITRSNKLSFNRAEAIPSKIPILKAIKIEVKANKIVLGITSCKIELTFLP